MLMDLFDAAFVFAILKINIPLCPLEDKFVWVEDLKGLFSVKSATKLLQNQHDIPNVDPCWSALWKSEIHERLKTFLWHIGSEILPTNDALG